MSAQERKDAGKTTPYSSTPQKPEGGFSKFLRRFVGMSAEQQSSQAVNTQPPSGLEGFAFKIQTGIDNQLELKRQQALRESLESAEMSARIAELEAEKQRRISEIEERDREAAEKGTRILKDLRVAERLEYIQDKVWEGRGQIRATERVRSLYDGINKSLSTLELNYQFPALRVSERFETDWAHGGSVDSYWQFVPAMASTSLLVEVIDIGVRRGIPDLEIRVFSEVMLDRSTVDQDHAEIYSAFILVGTETTEKELETALVQETANRVKRNFIPPRLEEFEGEALRKARRSPGWQKWISGSYNRSGEYYHESIGYRK